jgi:hypothetical protein
MDDEAIRGFLGPLRRIGMGVPHGHVGIARSVVEEAGGDLATVESWVERHGGEVVRSSYESKALGGGPWRKRSHDTSHYLKLRGTAGPAGPAGVAGVAGPAGPAGAAELQEDSVGGRELRFGAVGQDEIFDGSVRGVEVADGSLTSDDFSVAAGRVVDNGSDLAPGECSTNTVDVGTANISNDVVAVTLDNASFGSTPTSVRHAISSDSFVVVICNGTGDTQARPDFDWMVFNRP